MASGLKKNQALDLGLIVSERPAQCAGVFTANRVVAAPLQVSAPRVRAGQCQAILVNSKNANACTGQAGLADANACSSALAEVLDLDNDLIAIASTGVIGQRLDVGKIVTALPELRDNLSPDAAGDVAEAMMTTDSFSKVSAAFGAVADTGYAILGLAKGAGMIHPNMATMLGFVMTDVGISSALLDKALRQAVDQSFNRITVDRDTSTNDMVLLLANGATGAVIDSEGDDFEIFVRLLQEVLLDLAKMIVSDGEGATKLVKIEVTGAADDNDGLQAATAIATSNLVKTAFFGEDANWGRIIAAVGYSGAEVDPDKVSISFDGVMVAENGLAGSAEQEAAATAVMKLPEFTVTVDLGLGNGSAFYYTSDLTYDYVKINADYRT